jgi:tetratricopeptide (TPR) repeat protein
LSLCDFVAKTDTFVVMKRFLKIFIGMLLFIINMNSFSQEKDKDLPKANEDFASKNYSEAEAGYRVSSSNDSKKAAASYNLGNAIYSQKYAGEAKLAFAKAAIKSKAFPEKHNAYHNMGNSLMLEKKYDEAMEAYKNALRNNPEDEETRYNFALAKKKDKENPNKDKDKKKDDKKDDKKEDKKDDPKKPEDKDKPKPEPSKASQEQLKNLMEAVNNEEKKVQAKVNKGKQKGEPVQTDKDW